MLHLRQLPWTYVVLTFQNGVHVLWFTLQGFKSKSLFTFRVNSRPVHMFSRVDSYLEFLYIYWLFLYESHCDVSKKSIRRSYLLPFDMKWLDVESDFTVSKQTSHLNTLMWIILTLVTLSINNIITNGWHYRTDPVSYSPKQNHVTGPETKSGPLDSGIHNATLENMPGAAPQKLAISTLSALFFFTPHV